MFRYLRALLITVFAWLLVFNSAIMSSADASEQLLMPLVLVRDAFFGCAVSVDENIAFLGAWGDDNLSRIRTGAAYVFRYNGDTWSQAQKLFAENGTRNARFGYAVSVSGNVALVGAPHHENRGSAHVFRFDGNTWIEAQMLRAADSVRDVQFGYAVSVSGNVALVGAPHHENRGSAHVFRYNGSTWIEEQTLRAADGTRGALFGTSVSVDGDYVLVGAPRQKDRGAVYVFWHNGIFWAQEQTLPAPGSDRNPQFGYSVAISGDAALVGAPRHDSQGAAYLYRQESRSWIKQQKLIAPYSTRNAQFGYSVAINRHTALVGAWGDDNGNGVRTGSAYVFRYDGNSWSRDGRLLSAEGVRNAQFGYAVSVDENTAAVGAPHHDNKGSGHLFQGK